MEGQSGPSELSVISWVSAVEGGCPLSGVPLYFTSFPHEGPGNGIDFTSAYLDSFV